MEHWRGRCQASRTGVCVGDSGGRQVLVLEIPVGAKCWGVCGVAVRCGRASVVKHRPLPWVGGCGEDGGQPLPTVLGSLVVAATPGLWIRLATGLRGAEGRRERLCQGFCAYALPLNRCKGSTPLWGVTVKVCGKA